MSEWLDADRFFGGVELYKAGKAPLLVFTGGWAPWRPDANPEGNVLIQYAQEFGIPGDRLLTTPKVVNTAEEARAVACPNETYNCEPDGQKHQTEHSAGYIGLPYAQSKAVI